MARRKVNYESIVKRHPYKYRIWEKVRKDAILSSLFMKGNKLVRIITPVYCVKCRYMWYPKNKDIFPQYCPRCKCKEVRQEVHMYW